MFLYSPVPVRAFTLVATSTSSEDAGYLQIDLSRSAAGGTGKSESGRTRSRCAFKFQSAVANGMELSIAFRVYNAAQDSPDKAQEIYPFGKLDRTINVIQLRPDSDPEKANLLKEERDIESAIEAFEQGVSLLTTDDARLPNFLDALGSAYESRYETWGQREDIEKAITKQQAACVMTPEGHANLPGFLNNLGNSLLRRSEWTGELADVSEAIRVQQQAVRITPEGHANLPSRLSNLGNSFLHRFEQAGDDADISQAIQLLRQATELTPQGHSDLPSRLHSLGNSILRRFERAGKLADITEAVQLLQNAVELTARGDTELPSRLNGLGNAISCRFERSGDLGDISEAIQIQKQVVELTHQGHSNLPLWLNNLGTAFWSRFERFGDLADVSEAIQIQKQVVALTPKGHSSLPSRLNNLSNCFLSRFERSGDLGDIPEAVQLQQQAVELTPKGHSDLPGLLNNLGNSFFRQYERSRHVADISEAIRLQRQAVEFTPPGHPDLPFRLNNLGNSLFIQFAHSGDLADISEAVQIQKQAVELTPREHSNLPSLLQNLGNSFLSQFSQSGDLADITEAVQLLRDAVELTPKGQSDLPFRLDSLSSAILDRFEQSSDLGDLSEAIQIQQQAVQLTPKGHSNMPGLLNNLGSAFLRQFERSGDLADISEAIQLQRQAVELTPEGHFRLPSRLNNLGNFHLRRFEQFEDPADISESIQLHKQAVTLTPEGHSDLPSWLNSLGNSFSFRFERSADPADISEAIRLIQQAVEFTPKGHSKLPSRLNSLGNLFAYRFARFKNLADISEAIHVHQEAAQLIPDGHSDMPILFHNLGRSLLYRFEQTKQPADILEAASKFQTAALSITGSSSIIMTAAQAWAKASSHFSLSEPLKAHRRIMELLSVIAGLENTLDRRHLYLLDKSKLSTTAAASALLARHPTTALEWLEEGRCIVWNQINQLRAPVDDLRSHDPTLADRFIDLSKRLESAGTRMDPRRPDIDIPMERKISLQNEARNHLMLAKERDRVLETIRHLPGFNDFLQPKKCADLMSGLPEDGPVIIINAADDRCDVLALIAGCNEPKHITLPKFSFERATNLAEGLREYLLSYRLRTRYPEELETITDLRAMRRERLDASSERGIHGILQALWTDLVEPILEALGMKVEHDETDRPRIWWCPTGPFAFLPIHAAGVYLSKEESAERRCLADFAISSYIPTLSILKKLRLRKATKANDGVLLVSQPHTPGLGPIPSTSREVKKTRAELEQRKIKSDLYENEQATVAVISDALGSYPCIHLACHASQDVENPLESAIYLHDGPLKLREIMKKDLPHADLAFMSACQTSAGAEKLPEEAVHLAAGMLAVGYRGVIATMWAIADRHAPDVAENFYKCLLNEETAEGAVKLEVTGSARALHIATQALRRSLGDTTEGLLAWIPYVHYGI